MKKSEEWATADGGTWRGGSGRGVTDRAMKDRRGSDLEVITVLRSGRHLLLNGNHRQ